MADSKYKVLFLDFYGTIAAGDAEVIHRVCQRLVRDLDLSFSPEDLTIAWGDRFFATAGACNHHAFRNLHQCESQSLIETIEPLRGRIDPTPYVDELTAYWCAPDLQPESRRFLADLSLPTCCVSNADTAHLNRAIDRHSLSFTKVLTSEDVRAYKPDPRIFEQALEAMGAQPDEVLHVGDSLHSDVAGAAKLGIDTAWICRDRRIYDIGRCEALHKICSLNDLQAILFP